MKTPFASKEKFEEIAAQYGTPIHIYDERGIRENARRLNKAFSWNPGYKEYFAVKATPTPKILKILKEEGCGVDCSSSRTGSIYSFPFSIRISRGRVIMPYHS